MASSFVLFLRMKTSFGYFWLFFRISSSHEGVLPVKQRMEEVKMELVQLMEEEIEVEE
jgi:hypothetical protein